MFTTLKFLHVSSVILSATGFLLRGWWTFQQSSAMKNKLVSVMPHVVDTILLISGIGMLVVLRLPVLQQPWLLAKFAALPVYIVLGAIALRHGRSQSVRRMAFVMAVLTLLYIIGAAIRHSPMSWLAA